MTFAGVCLATGPATIIAAAAHVDASFVRTLRLVRGVAVMALGPALSRYLAGKLPA